MLTKSLDHVEDLLVLVDQGGDLSVSVYGDAEDPLRCAQLFDLEVFFQVVDCHLDDVFCPSSDDHVVHVDCYDGCCSPLV